MDKAMEAVQRTAAWFKQADWPQTIVAGALTGVAVGMLAVLFHTAF